MPNKITSYKGVWYWNTYNGAKKYADKLGYTRIIKHGLGWAVQSRISGPYIGEEFNKSVLNTISIGPMKQFKEISKGCWLLED
jgi:hypothetical protein